MVSTLRIDGTLALFSIDTRQTECTQHKYSQSPHLEVLCYFQLNELNRSKLSTKIFFFPFFLLHCTVRTYVLATGRKTFSGYMHCLTYCTYGPVKFCCRREQVGFYCSEKAERYHTVSFEKLCKTSYRLKHNFTYVSVLHVLYIICLECDTYFANTYSMNRELYE